MDRILRLEFNFFALVTSKSLREMEGFRLFTQKKFQPLKGRFMVSSEHFTEDCFRRLFHMEGNVRRLQPGSIPTIWRKSEKSVDQPLSHRSRRKVRIECFYFIFFELYSL